MGFRWSLVGAAVLVFGASGAALAAGPATVIVGATVFDGTGAAPRVASVVLRDGRIVEVGAKVKTPPGAIV